LKRTVYSKAGKKKSEVELPPQFQEQVRPLIIRRAVLSTQSKKHQLHTRDELSGKRKSTYLSKKRRKYRGTYGYGTSRTPMKVMWRRGMRFGYEGGFAPMTKGGRMAHPPRSKKTKKVNKKERLLAIRSALSACALKELVQKRGHVINSEPPLIVEDSVQEIKQTKEVKQLLENLGLKEELERASEKKIRAGKGKLRGRKYKKKTGPLIITSESCALNKSAKNIPGVQTTTINKLSAEKLAPGGEPGRLCVFTLSAIKKLQENNLYTQDQGVKKC